MATSFRPKTITHQRVDHELMKRGHLPLRSLVLADLAALSWRRVAQWVDHITGIELTGAAIWQWFRDDAEVTAARHLARHPDEAAA